MMMHIGVRMSLLCLLVAGMSSCAPDSPSDMAPGDISPGWTVISPSSSEPDASDTTEIGVAGDVITQSDGCSVVQWCDVPSNLPNGWEGARCLQRGCTLDAALNECVIETWRVCGTPKCPWAFVALDGTRFYRDPCPGPKP